MKEDVIAEWRNLDRDVREFVLRADYSSGTKNGCNPISKIIDDGSEYGKHFPFYDVAEEHGFVVCVGSYRWESTDKFRQVRDSLLLSD